MSITPVLPRLLDALFSGNRAGNVPQNSGNPLDDGPGRDSRPNGDAQVRSLPPGIERQLQTRGLDGLPPGLARQFAQNPPPPGALPLPNTPNSAAAPGSTPLPTAPGQAIAQAAGTLASAPARALEVVLPPSNPNGAGNPTAMRGEPDGLSPGATARSASGGTPVAQPFSQATAAATSTSSQVAQTAAPTAPAALRAVSAANPALPASSVSASAAAAPQGTTAMPATRAPEAVAAQARAETAPAPVRNEQSVLDRVINLMRPASDIVRNALPALVARDAVQALPLTATTQPLAAPASQAMPDARVMGVVGNERAPVTRMDTIMTPVYTGTGPARRSGRLDGFQEMLKRMRSTLAAGGDAEAPQARPDKDVWFALQWTFWVLAIVAYGCLAVAMIALLADGRGMFGTVVDHRTYYTGGAAVIGLLAGAGAWWLGRRLSRR